MKPLIKYPGGKRKETPQIIKYFPKYEGRYIEPFLGGGALYFYLEPMNAIVNDINYNLMNFYNAVKSNYYQLKEEIQVIERIYRENQLDENGNDLNEKLYYKLRGMYNGIIKAEYSQSALYYFINKTAFGGMIRYNKKGEFNVPFGRYKSINSDLLTEQHHHLLANTQIYNKDYRDILNLTHNGDFVFFDPPYDCTFSDYGNNEYKDGFNESNHRQLANDFCNLGCRAMMVIGSTPLTRELYGKKTIAEYNKIYSANIKNHFRSEAKHLIVTNYSV